MAKKIGFCVVKIGWEYDDEKYYRADSGGGVPLKVFVDRNKAEAECEKMNRREGGITTEEWDEEAEKYRTVAQPSYEITEVEIE